MYGHVVGANPHDQAYVVPISATKEQIRKALRATKLSLPLPPLYQLHDGNFQKPRPTTSNSAELGPLENFSEYIDGACDSDIGGLDISNADTTVTLTPRPHPLDEIGIQGSSVTAFNNAVLKEPPDFKKRVDKAGVLGISGIGITATPSFGLIYNLNTFSHRLAGRFKGLFGKREKIDILKKDTICIDELPVWIAPLAPRPRVIGIFKKDPLDGIVRVSMIVNDRSDIDLISPIVVDVLGLADDIQSCNISRIKGLSGEKRARIKGVLWIKFVFMEDAVGVFPSYQQRHVLPVYVLEDFDCPIDVSVCEDTARLLRWADTAGELRWVISKYMGTRRGNRVAPLTKNPGEYCS